MPSDAPLSLTRTPAAGASERGLWRCLLPLHARGPRRLPGGSGRRPRHRGPARGPRTHAWSLHRSAQRPRTARHRATGQGPETRAAGPPRAHPARPGASTCPSATRGNSGVPRPPAGQRGLRRAPRVRPRPRPGSRARGPARRLAGGRRCHPRRPRAGSRRLPTAPRGSLRVCHVLPPFRELVNSDSGQGRPPGLAAISQRRLGAAAPPAWGLPTPPHPRGPAQGPPRPAHAFHRPQGPRPRTDGLRAGCSPASALRGPPHRNPGGLPGGSHAKGPRLCAGCTP